MTYDFTTLPDRWDTGAEKYELMKKRCPDVPRGTVPFSVADMDFLPPPELSEGVQDFMRGRVFGYTRTPREYIAAFQRWMQRRHGVDIPAAWVVDADSVLGAMHRMIRAFTRPGDGIVVLTPAYPPFLDAPEPLNRRRLACPMVLGDDRRYTIDFALLEDLCRQADTTMLIFCNPHNPVGRVWTEDEVRNIVELCKKYSVWLFSDEIHGDVVLYGHQYTSAARFADVYDHMLVYTAISKTFNMAGLHSSCTIIPNPEYKKIQEDTLRQAWLMSPNCMANSAIEACYTYGDEWVDEQNAYLTENAEFVTSYLKEHAPQIKPVKPEGTYLMWLDCSELSMTSEEIVKILASEYKMAVGGGAGYQGNGEYFLRFNIGCPRETLEKGMEILAQFVADKKGV